MNIVMLLFKDIHYDARVQREAKALAEDGHEVTLICVNEFNYEAPSIHENVYIHKLHLFAKQAKQTLTSEQGNHKKSSVVKKLIFKFVRSSIIKVMKDFFSYREFYKKSKQILHEKNYDVIHCHDLNTLMQGYYLSKRYKSILVYDSHELFNEMAGRKRSDKIIGNIMEKHYYKKIDHLITVNPFLQKELKRRYGFKPFTIVQNTPIYNQKMVKNEHYFHKKYQLDSGDRVLLYQGGLNPERGIEECIEAVKLLPERYKFVLLGDGRSKNLLEKLVKDLSLERRVFLHDQVPSTSILWYTCQADIGFVVYKKTSLNNYLSTPNKIFEYMLAGIPAVSSNHPGKSYVIEKEKTGVCVEETPEAIKEGVLLIDKNYSFYQDNCLRAKEQYTWDVEKNNLSKLYRDIEEQLDVASKSEV